MNFILALFFPFKKNSKEYLDTKGIYFQLVFVLSYVLLIVLYIFEQDAMISGESKSLTLIDFLPFFIGSSILLNYFFSGFGMKRYRRYFTIVERSQSETPATVFIVGIAFSIYLTSVSYFILIAIDTFINGNL